MKPSKEIFVLFIALSFFCGCNQRQANEYSPAFSKNPVKNPAKTLSFAIRPLHNPQRLYEIYNPIIELINQKLPADLQIVFEASRNYAAFDEKLKDKKVAFAIANPYETVLAADNGYQIFGKMCDDHKYRGLFLLRKDSPVQTPADLKGKSISFPAPTAFAASMLPQYFLYQHGLKPDVDYECKYVGSQESSIQNVYQQSVAVAAAATWPQPWEIFRKERAEINENVYVKWETPPLSNNGLIVRQEDVPEIAIKAVEEVFLNLHRHEYGKALLQPIEISCFEPADYKTYEPVRRFLADFNQNVRTINLSFSGTSGKR